MFYSFKNFTKYNGKYSSITNSVNSLQLITLSKHDVFPYNNKFFMKNVPTNIIIHTGKILINLNKQNQLNKIENRVLFCEPFKLFTTDKDNEITLTEEKYILTIPPKIFFSFYSYETAIFQLMFKSNNLIRNYTINRKKNIYISSIEHLK